MPLNILIIDYDAEACAQIKVLTGTLIGRRPASQAIVSASAELEISGQPSTPVYRRGTCGQLRDRDLRWSAVLHVAPRQAVHAQAALSVHD
jgi:hypothetical protein